MTIQISTTNISAITVHQHDANPRSTMQATALSAEGTRAASVCLGITQSGHPRECERLPKVHVPNNVPCEVMTIYLTQITPSLENAKYPSARSSKSRDQSYVSQQHEKLIHDTTPNMPLVDSIVSMWSFCPTGGQVQLPPAAASSGGGSGKEATKPVPKTG